MKKALAGLGVAGTLAAIAWLGWLEWSRPPQIWKAIAITVDYVLSPGTLASRKLVDPAVVASMLSSLEVTGSLHQYRPTSSDNPSRVVFHMHSGKDWTAWWRGPEHLSLEPWGELEITGAFAETLARELSRIEGKPIVPYSREGR